MNHGKDVFLKCAGTKLPCLLKREAKCRSSCVVIRQHVPWEIRTDRAVYPHVPIHRTNIWPEKDGKGHGGANCVNDPQIRVRRRIHNHCFVGMKITHNNVESRQIPHQEPTSARLYTFQKPRQLSRQRRAVVKPPFFHNSKHIRDVYIPKLGVIGGP